MPEANSFPEIVGPPHPERKAADISKATGKTVASVEFGVESSNSERHKSEVIILHFTDDTSLAIMASSKAGNHTDAVSIETSDVDSYLMIYWKGEDEREAYDDSLAM